MTRFSALLLAYPPSRHWHGLPSPLSPSTPLCHHQVISSSHGHLLLIIVSPYTTQFNMPQLVTWRWMSMFRYLTQSLKRSSSYHGSRPRSVIAPVSSARLDLADFENLAAQEKSLRHPRIHPQAVVHHKLKYSWWSLDGSLGNLVHVNIDELILALVR